MARTNGDLDYDNWVFFFTGHGASGGGSDLDQGDTRRELLAHDIGVFVQDDWRVGGGLTLNAGLRYDVFGNFTERNGRIGNYYLPDAAAEARRRAGFQVPGNAPFFQPGLRPAADRPLRRSRVHRSTSARFTRRSTPRRSTATSTTSRRASASPGSRRSRRRSSSAAAGASTTSAPAPATSATCSSRRRSSFYQNVPAPLNMADPYPRLNINPFQIPLQRADRARCQRRAALGARRRHGVPGHVARSAPRATPSSIRCCARRTCSSGRSNVQYELAPRHAARPRLRRLARRRPARQGESARCRSIRA